MCNSDTVNALQTAYVLGDIVSRVCISVLQQFRELIIYPLCHGEYITYYSHWLILCLLEIHTCTCVCTIMYMYCMYLKYSDQRPIYMYVYISPIEMSFLSGFGPKDALLTELSWVS